MSEAPEHLVRIKLEDGTSIDFSRMVNNDVHICRDGHCVILPHCTGQQTLDLFALLEPFGEIEEESDGAA